MPHAQPAEWRQNDLTNSISSDRHDLLKRSKNTTCWQARFVTPPWDDEAGDPAPLLRREFDVIGTVRSAALRATALGVHELLLNGRPVGSDVLAPGWTSYRHRLLYQTFDVTGSLRVGRNALGAMLGDGWYRGRLGFHGGLTNIYGARLALLAQLEIEYDDGSTEIVVTDERWRASTGPILSSGLYDGETYDARLEQPGWADEGFDDRSWPSVRVLEYDLDVLRSRLGRRFGASSSSSPSRSSRRLPGGRSSTSGRTSSAVFASPSRAKQDTRSRSGTRRCWRTVSSVRDRFAMRARLTATRCAATASRRGSPASRSTDSATPRSTAGRVAVRSEDVRALSCCTPTWSEQAGSSARTRLLERLHENVALEHARQLPRTPDRLPAAGRAPRLDRRHPGVRAGRGVPLRRRRLPSLLACRSGAPSRALTARCRTSCRTSWRCRT